MLGLPTKTLQSRPSEDMQTLSTRSQTFRGSSLSQVITTAGFCSGTPRLASQLDLPPFSSLRSRSMLCAATLASFTLALQIQTWANTLLTVNASRQYVMTSVKSIAQFSIWWQVKSTSMFFTTIRA